MKQQTADPLTMVYHELRGPLGLMATAARSAADDCTDDGLRARCEIIVRAAERMLRTAGHVLELAQATQSQETELFDPAECVRNTVNHLADMSVPVLISQDCHADGELAHGNRHQLEVLIQSLVGNASDHADPGTLIRVTLDNSDGDLRIEISNRRSAVQRHRGLGLGLHICENLSERLGTSLECGAVGDDFVSVLTVPLVAQPMAIAV